MAGAIVGGLVAGGRPAESILVVDPGEAQRRRLVGQFGVRALAAADAVARRGRSSSSGRSSRSSFAPPPRRARRMSRGALQLSVMAGDPQRRDRRRDRQRARRPRHAEHAGADRPGRRRRVRAAGGHRRRTAPTPSPLLGADRRARLARRRGGARCGDRALGLGAGLRVPSDRGDARGRPRRWACGDDAARRLAVQTVAGAAALAAASRERRPLRRNVTSPGGTTACGDGACSRRAGQGGMVEAILAARDRARELGDEFGGRPRSTARGAHAALQGDSAPPRARVAGWPDRAPPFDTPTRTLDELPLLPHAHGDEPLAHLSRAGRPRPALPRPAGALVGDAQAPEARPHRRRADRDGRRHASPTSRAFASSTTCRAARARAACATTPT